MEKSDARAPVKLNANTDVVELPALKALSEYLALDHKLFFLLTVMHLCTCILGVVRDVCFADLVAVGDLVDFGSSEHHNHQFFAVAITSNV